MSPMVYNEEEGYYEESEGWRSWGCTKVLIDYLIVLALAPFYVLLWLLVNLPFVIVGLAIAFGIAMLLGLI